VQAFVEECGLPDSVGELHAKFNMAKSVVETFIDGNNSAEVVLLLQWAGGMCELYREICDAFGAGRPLSSVQVRGRRGGLADWYRELEASRRKIDEDTVAGKMLSGTCNDDLTVYMYTLVDCLSVRTDSPTVHTYMHTYLLTYSFFLKMMR
jgi:hypothetical protein